MPEVGNLQSFDDFIDSGATSLDTSPHLLVDAPNQKATHRAVALRLAEKELHQQIDGQQCFISFGRLSAFLVRRQRLRELLQIAKNKKKTNEIK